MSGLSFLGCLTAKIKRSSEFVEEFEIGVWEKVGRADVDRFLIVPVIIAIQQGNIEPFSWFPKVFKFSLFNKFKFSNFQVFKCFMFCFMFVNF